MKKKIILLLCVLVATLSFVGCSGKKEAGVSDEQIENMKIHSELMLEMCTNAEGIVGVSQEAFLETINSYSEFEMNSFLLSLNNFYAQYGIPGIDIDADDFRGIFSSWEAAVDECGEFEGLGEFKVDEDGLTVSVEAKFKNRDAVISFSFDEDYKMESMDVSAIYSTGEILQKAGLNTLLGMGTVFAVLVFLAFLISLMKYIPVLMDLLKKKEEKSEHVVETSAAPVDADETDTVDDLELIAVITAAIAAQEGTDGSGFVVRSIRRRPSNNWM